MPKDNDGLRIDRWLFYCRFFKTRSLASKACTAGGLRVEGAPVSKANSKVKVGDVLTFPQGRHIRVVKVLRSQFEDDPDLNRRFAQEAKAAIRSFVAVTVADDVVP